MVFFMPAIIKAKDVVKTFYNRSREVADRVLLMGAGKLAEEGTPEQIFSNPQNEPGCSSARSCNHIRRANG